MEANEPKFKIVINGKDATKDLSPYLLELSYTDNYGGKADELKITVDNTDFRFFSNWYMTPGMIIQAWIEQMYCGKFTIDAVNETGPPDVATVMAQSALYHSPTIRAQRSWNHSQKSLKEIVQKYADDNNWKLQGEIPDLALDTIIQSFETDIQFLARIADDYGCVFMIKDDTLIFDDLDNTWKQKSSRVLNKRDMISYHFSTQLDVEDDEVTVVHSSIADDTTTKAVVANADNSSSGATGGTPQITYKQGNL